ncbi:hypothetical protein QZH41_010584 [Actinostola sp. cb2023]|nr:hypothetical protein QZH41_010584 [Actinostola sp. cb2023]
MVGSRLGWWDPGIPAGMSNNPGWDGGIPAGTVGSRLGWWDPGWDGGILGSRLGCLIIPAGMVGSRLGWWDPGWDGGIPPGERVNNWEFFRQQWEDYEVATGLEKRDPKIRLPTLRDRSWEENGQLRRLEEFECKLQEKVADLPGVKVLRDDILVIGYAWNNAGGS